MKFSKPRRSLLHFLVRGLGIVQLLSLTLITFLPAGITVAETFEAADERLLGIECWTEFTGDSDPADQDLINNHIPVFQRLPLTGIAESSHSYPTVSQTWLPQPIRAPPTSV